MITATDWTESFLGRYLQGQEKLTFFVILLFFTLTLCCTLISANEKIYDSIEEQTVPADTESFTNLFPFSLFKYIFSTVSSSVKTILTMPFVLRRLTLAECSSWFVKSCFVCSYIIVYFS